MTTALCETDPHARDWHRWRSQGIGASDAPIVAGLSRYKSRYRLWLEKTGRAEPQAATEAMEWGLALEPVIAAAYCKRTGSTLSGSQTMAEHPCRPWMRATLDALSSDDRVVEFKTAGAGTARQLGEDGDGDGIPIAWTLQVQHQLAVTGLDRADVAVFVAPSLELRVYPVERSPSLIDALIESEQEFWDSVRANAPPALECADDYLDWTRRFGPKGERIELDSAADLIADDYLHYSEQIRLLEVRKADSKRRLIEALSGHERGITPGNRVVRLQAVDIPERTQAVKAHTQLRLTIKDIT